MRDETLLLRQINPKFLQNGEPTRQVFSTFAGPIAHLSVYDGDQIPADRAYQQFTETLKANSARVMAVAVRECRALDLPAQNSPDPFPEHAHIDFTACSKSQVRSKSLLLLNFATTRGWLYQHEA